jgi:hypothetical protein
MAVLMWFLELEPVAIHLLVMPAYHVLCDLGRRTGNAPKIHDFVGDRFDTAYDWLRHVSSDPHDIIDFPPRVNDFLIWVCTRSFEEIFGVTTARMRAFQAYFVLWLVPEKPKFRESADAFLPDKLSVKEAVSFSRTEFFVKLTEMFSAQMKPMP